MEVVKRKVVQKDQECFLPFPEEGLQLSVHAMQLPVAVTGKYTCVVSPAPQQV